VSYKVTEEEMASQKELLEREMTPKPIYPWQRQIISALKKLDPSYKEREKEAKRQKKQEIREQQEIQAQQKLDALRDFFFNLKW
jgi:hypothetical protein